MSKKQLWPYCRANKTLNNYFGTGFSLAAFSSSVFLCLANLYSLNLSSRTEIGCYKFQFFYRWPGRAHDSRVYSYSPLKEEIADLCYIPNQRLDQTYHLLGDSGFPLSNYLITPFKRRRNGMSAAHKKFNTHHASKREVIERAIGLLSLRFPRLCFLKVRSDEKRVMCIMAACVLHNWCLMEDDDDESAFEALLEGEGIDNHVCDRLPATAAVGVRRAAEGGTSKRDILCNIIQTLK